LFIATIHREFALHARGINRLREPAALHGSIAGGLVHMVRRTCHAAVIDAAGLTFWDDDGLLLVSDKLQPQEK
jgi:hypothetical protein